MSASLRPPGRRSPASVSGCPAQVRKLCQSSSLSQRSATPANWNRSMYHDFSRCRGLGGRWTDARPRGRPGGRPGRARGMPSPRPGPHPSRGRPREPGRPAGSARIASTSPASAHHRVRFDGRGLVRAPVAAQVGHDDLESGLGQGRHLVPPEPPGVGKAVQQHDRYPLPRYLVFGADPVRRSPGPMGLLPATGRTARIACHPRALWQGRRVVVRCWPADWAGRYVRWPVPPGRDRWNQWWA